MCEIFKDTNVLTLHKLVNKVLGLFYWGCPPPPNLAKGHFLVLKNLLQYVVLPLNSKKVEEPRHSITCLSI